MAVTGGIVYSVDNSASYTAQTATTTPEVQLPEWASDTEAVEAAQAVIHKKALTEEIKSLDNEIDSVTATYEAQLGELKTKKEEKQKELDSY